MQIRRSAKLINCSGRFGGGFRGHCRECVEIFKSIRPTWLGVVCLWAVTIGGGWTNCMFVRRSLGGALINYAAPHCVLSFNWSWVNELTRWLYWGLRKCNETFLNWMQVDYIIILLYLRLNNHIAGLFPVRVSLLRIKRFNCPSIYREDVTHSMEYCDATWSVRVPARLSVHLTIHPSVRLCS